MCKCNRTFVLIYKTNFSALNSKVKIEKNLNMLRAININDKLVA